MAENEALKRQLEESRAQLLLLQRQIDWLRQKLFGNGKGEALDRAQMLLQLEGLEAVKASLQSAATTVSYERTTAKKPARTLPSERFAHLPVEETVEILPAEVQANPELYERIGEEVTEEVDIRPPRLFKRRIVRPKVRHRIDRSRPPLVAPAPERAVEGGYVSAGLLAWIVSAKYLDHLPLYRQQAMFARQGVNLPRQSMADWVEVVARWLKPLYNLMRERLLQGDYLQADETPVRFLDPGRKKGKAFTGQLWLIGKPNGFVIFRWSTSRTNAAAFELLKGFVGLLQSDGYACYEAFARAHPKVSRAGCWAHARRRFYEASKEDPVAVHFVLRQIGHLYAYERQWDQRGLSSPRLRAVLRTAHFGQSLARLRAAALKLMQRHRPSSGIGQACTYLFNQWDYLLAACENGQCRIDNNLLENAVRPSALGKKNWLFIGSPEAGERTAVIYSMLISCQRFGVDPFTWLRDILTLLPTMSNQDDLSPLLPDRWKAPLSR